MKVSLSKQFVVHTKGTVFSNLVVIILISQYHGPGSFQVDFNLSQQYPLNCKILCAVILIKAQLKLDMLSIVATEWVSCVQCNIWSPVFLLVCKQLVYCAVALRSGRQALSHSLSDSRSTWQLFLEFVPFGAICWIVKNPVFMPWHLDKRHKITVDIGFKCC